MIDAKRSVTALSLLVLGVLMVSCGSPTGSDGEVSIRDLTLQAHPAVGTGNFVVDVEAVRASAGAEDRGDPVQVTVATSSGDEETFALRRKVCETEDGTEYICGEFILGVKDGHDIRGLAPRIKAELDGRLKLLTACGTDGHCHVVSDIHGLVVLFGGNLSETMTVVESWPEVSAADLNGIVEARVQGNGSGSEEEALELQARVPLDQSSSAVSGNGVVEARANETITATYRDVAGGELVERLTLQ